MRLLENIDLRMDAAASRYIKTEIVQVVFAPAPGEITSLEGPNHYQTGDALISSMTGERWSVDRQRFTEKYLPLPPVQAGQDGAYTAKPVPVFARQMDESFSLARSAGRDVLHGQAGDWLMQYAPGEYGVCANERFQRVYRRL